MSNELHIPQRRYLQIGASSSSKLAAETKNIDNISATRLSDSNKILPIFYELNTSSGSISQVFFLF